MAFVTGYATIAFADLYNTTQGWIDSTDAQKNLALSFARTYILARYTCLDKYTDTWDTDDDTTIPDEVKLANSIIAEKYVLGELSGNSFGTSGSITKKKVKAGPVETETTYEGTAMSRPRPRMVDYQEVTTLLASYCSWGNQNKSLTRA